LFPKGHYFSDGCKPEQKNFFFDGGDSNAIVPNTTVGWCIQVCHFLRCGACAYHRTAALTGLSCGEIADKYLPSSAIYLSIHPQ
jgi:hypothetical protein